MALRQKFYCCPSCDFVSICPKKLEFHQEKKCGNIKCPFCDNLFHGQNYFFLHLRLAHSQEAGSLTCQICDLNCKKKFNLERHILAKHSEFAKIHKCKICKKSFHRKDNCKVHESHCLKPKNLHQINCGKCKKKFWNILDFEKHKKLCISQYNKKKPKNTNSNTKRTHMETTTNQRKRTLPTAPACSVQSKVRKMLSPSPEQVPSSLQFRYGQHDKASITCRQCQMKFPSRDLFYRHWMKVRQQNFFRKKYFY